MNSENKHIVSIDFGTSKISITVAQVEGNDVQIIYYKETPAAGMRYSGIYNVAHVTESLKLAVAEAEEQLGIKINQAVVGVPKYPIRTDSAKQSIQDRGEDTDIITEDVEELKSFALSTYPNINENTEAIFGAVAQSFSDGENFQIIENDIVGMTSDVLEGNFKIFIGKKNDLKKIDTALSRVGLISANKYFTADTTANAVLHDAEKENGVALIDFGAGSTSVSIYQGNIMRHYASIPFGGNNITNDIKNEAEINEKLAENIKLAYGVCMPDKLLHLSDKVLHIRSINGDSDKTLPLKYLSEIITARIEEITLAIMYEIEKSGFADMLRSGIVVTGGVAQTANITTLIHDITGYKVRTGYPKQIFSSYGCDGIADTSAATSMGLIYAAHNGANINCAVLEEAEEDTAIEEVTEESGENTQPSEKTAEQVEIEKPVNKEEETVKANEEEEKKIKKGWGLNLWGETVKEEEKKSRRRERTPQAPRKGKNPIWTTFNNLFEEMGREMDDENV